MGYYARYNGTVDKLKQVQYLQSVMEQRGYTWSIMKEHLIVKTGDYILKISSIHGISID